MRKMQTLIKLTSAFILQVSRTADDLISLRTAHPVARTVIGVRESATTANTLKVNPLISYGQPDSQIHGISSGVGREDQILVNQVDSSLLSRWPTAMQKAVA